MMVENVFMEVAGVLALATALGIAAHLLRQPLIVAFLAAGILAGPAAFHIVRTEEIFGVLAQLGIALLLFAVGLKLDPRLIRKIGPVATMTGVGQIVFTSAIGFAIAHMFGFSVVEALYIAVALTFSSTIIITKLLADKRELEALHGRVAVGFLIIQDIFVVLVLVGMPLVGQLGDNGEGNAGWARLGEVAGAAVGLILGAWLLMRFVFPRFGSFLAGSRELLVLFAVAFGIGVATVSELVGLGLEMGAFVAGVALAASEYREAIGSRLVSLRDFMLLFFFVVLGAGLDLGLLAEQVPAALVLSLFVLVGNPLIVMVIMGVLGFRKRTGFLAGLTVAQISEFSLVLAALGLGLGHIDNDALGLITLVGLVTISVSAYLITFSHPIYERIHPVLGVFERRAPWREKEWEKGKEEDPEVVVFGLGRYGAHMASSLVREGYRVKGVDLDPGQVKRVRAEGIDALYGDAQDEEFPLTLPLAGVKLVVSTIADRATNRTLAQGLERSEFEGRFIVTAHTSLEARQMRNAGFEVLEPFKSAGEETGRRLGALLKEVEEEKGQDQEQDQRQEEGQ